MIRKSIDVSVEKEGARPIAMLVQVASQYRSSVNICQDNKTVNAKSIMGMMTLGLIPGRALEITVDGEDEEIAMKSIEEYLTGK
ncbi:MAG: HPr family phosphocarrier protein [Lachnospiraceae bacterium]|nr:HPr family phosphocarrier protein [Lachnospiraceae bacterium]